MILVSTIFLATVFQNCSGSPFAGMRSSPSNSVQAENPLPFEHPATEIQPQGDPVSGQLILGDRLYLQSVFRDVFTPPGSAADVVNYVETVLYQEFVPVQGALGRACDVNQDGTLDDCGASVPNLDIKMNAGTSSIREAARLQVCRRLLGNNRILETMVSQVKGNQATPNATSISALVFLFFPAENVPASLNSKLMELDQEMAEAGESLETRWSILFLTVCESPAWQVL